MAINRILRPPLAAFLLLAANGTWAALGEAAAPGPVPGFSSVSQRTPAGAAYTRVQHVQPGGVSVSEYVDAGGQVFAVAWSGPTLPELGPLLGRYHAVFEQNAAAVGKRSSVAIRGTDVVILSRGRMGAFQGRAWLPARLPMGFDVKGME